VRPAILILLTCECLRLGSSSTAISTVSPAVPATSTRVSGQQIPRWRVYAQQYIDSNRAPRRHFQRQSAQARQHDALLGRLPDGAGCGALGSRLQNGASALGQRTDELLRNRRRHANRAGEPLRRESRRPLYVVAEMLGFSDSSSFSRRFRRRFGSNVSAWRAINLTSGKSQPSQ
jgi:AraC-like DNA-binding protein